jgi:hypothetical protein
MAAACVLSSFDPLEGRQEWPERKLAAGARVSMIGEKAVGVMEPGGRFVLCSLPDGRTIADLKLEGEPSLREITLLESRGQYFLLTSDSTADNDIRWRRNPRGGGGRRGFQSICPSKTVGNGRLYALDRQGKLLWPDPVRIEDQCMPINQPADLPILTFACRVFDGKGGRKTSLLCVDKRSGRTVYQGEEVAGSVNFFQVAGDAKKKTVDLMDSTHTVVLTFTDKPWPSGSGTGTAAGKSP